MADYRTPHSHQAAQNTPLGAQTFTAAELLDRHLIRAHVGHSVGDAAPRDGLRLRDDLLATAARLAGSRCVANRPRDSVGQAAQRRPDRLYSLCGRQRHHSCGRGGEKTGPSPVDRRKPGSKHHILTDGNGIPVVAHTTAANQHDVTELLELVNDVPAIKGRTGAPRYRFDELYADRAYDSDPHRQALREVGTTPLILITGDRDLELLGRHEENAYMMRMMKVVGHRSTFLYEVQGFDHGGMVDPAFSILLKHVNKIVESHKKHEVQP